MAVIDTFNWKDIIDEFSANNPVNRHVEFDEIDVEGHCLGCEQPLDDYHLKGCEYYGCSLCGRTACVCDG